MIVRVPYKFFPRAYQIEAFEKLTQGYRHFYFVEHRRCGKDKKTINMLILRALMRVGLHIYLFPEGKQGAKAIWTGRGSDGLLFLDHIPPQLKKGNANKINMSQELKNGSIIQVVGASNIDSLRGSNPLTVACSEFTYMSSYVRTVYSPILSENGGTEILNGTPNGKGPAYQTFLYARQNTSEWCTSYLTVNDTFREDGVTPVISQAAIDEFRRSGEPEERIQQEYYCSWESGSVGAYYSELLSKAMVDGRICDFQISRKPVITFWDIGIGDSMAIWFLQPDGDKLQMIHYYEDNGKGFEHYYKLLKELELRYGFKYLYHFGPHDLVNRQHGVVSPRTTISIAAEAGIKFLIVPRDSIESGIQAVRSILPRVWFHQTHCAPGLECLKHYKKLWNEDKRVFEDKPFKDWSSHGADAFRYFAMVWQNQFARPELNQPRAFENKFILS